MNFTHKNYPFAKKLMERKTKFYRLAVQMANTICKPTMNELGGLPALLFSFK
jgi:hypothetical protein